MAATTRPTDPCSTYRSSSTSCSGTTVHQDEMIREAAKVVTAANPIAADHVAESPRPKRMDAYPTIPATKQKVAISAGDAEKLRGPWSPAGRGRSTP